MHNLNPDNVENHMVIGNDVNLTIVPGYDDGEIERCAEFDDNPHAALVEMAQLKAEEKHPELLLSPVYAAELRRYVNVELESLLTDLLKESWNDDKPGQYFAEHMNALRNMYATGDV